MAALASRWLMFLSALVKNPRRLLPLLLCVVIPACASVSVREVTPLTAHAPTAVPEMVFVKPFTFTDAKLRVDRSGADLETIKFDIRERMTRNLVQRLPKYAGPAKAVAATAPLPRGNYWLITGNFDRVNQGSRFLRAIVGLGLGGTKMETTTIVSDLSGPKPVPFLRIGTTGGSNVSPGIGGVATLTVSGPIALTSVFNAVDGVRSGITFDTIRSTREINAALSEYLCQRGAIPLEKATGPKRLGKLPNTFGTPDRAKARHAQNILPAEPLSATPAATNPQ